MRYVLVWLALIGGTRSVLAQPASGSQYDWRKPNSSGVFLDLGAGWERVHPNGFTYRSEYLRIAPAVSINHLIYIGAAFELGNIYSAYGSPDGKGAAVGANDFMDEGSGSTLAGQVFLGVRDLVGIVSFGGEVAPTFRETSAGMNFEYTADKTSVTTIELHARGDVWLVPNITAGVTVGMDVASIRDFIAGLQLGFHLEPYDAMRNRH